jgi:hypothetical protein
LSIGAFSRSKIGSPVERALEALVAAEWDTLRLLLHPYMRWRWPDGASTRGRTPVIGELTKQAEPPAAPASVELRDGWIYRWIS